MFVRDDMLLGRNRNRSIVTCSNGIVCASQPLASTAGIDILKAGMCTSHSCFTGTMM